MIGIIGYGMVGKAVEYGFPNTRVVVSDPAYNTVTIKDVCASGAEAIFVCVPTPTDDTNYELLRSVLTDIRDCNYSGITVLKSTVLPHHVELFDIVYNPEFLSRATSFNDFVNPEVLIIGGDSDSCKALLNIYEKYSIVKPKNVFLTDVKTASMAKYTMNSFYATKVTFMNEMYEVAQWVGVNWNELTDILKAQPWMGTHHFAVPGPDGKRGFGGPCLPKDTEALVKEFDVKLLKSVLERNKEFRK